MGQCFGKKHLNACNHTYAKATRPIFGIQFAQNTQLAAQINTGQTPPVTAAPGLAVPGFNV